MIAMYGFYFRQPWWLLACVLAAPVIWTALRGLRSLGRTRRIAAMVLRTLAIVLLSVLLARPTLTERDERLTVIAVVDRSKSVSPELQAAGLGFLAEAMSHKPPGDQLALIDIAEAASISRLPASVLEIPKRNIALTGGQSLLASGVQMAMAIAPPNTAVRILLVSDGNETEGDLKEAARIAAANGIPIDVLPLSYRHEREVIFQRLAAPSRARSGQTVALRFILRSTAPADGKLHLTLNGRPVDLDPTSPAIAAPVRLKAGTNVKTISLPLGTRGMHEFEATFIPDDPHFDGLTQNNRASAMTFVAGPGYVLVVDADGSAAPLVKALQASQIEVRYAPAGDLPHKLTKLVDVDAIVLVGTDNSNFTFQQQEMLCRYVTDLGGGLVMVGGPESFGAGGWIGSPVADILPVDLDPPQKKQMPKGALVLIMHACEMPRGNYWGKPVGIAAVNTLSRLDLIGVLDYGWGAGQANWVHPLSPAGDKTQVIAAIKKMQMGDMPDYHAPMQAAYQRLKNCDAVQKHVILISDGDASPPSAALLKSFRQSGITCTGVAVFPHSPNDVQSLQRIAAATGGRFYNVKDPNKLPQIFVKEAQVVRRALIVEETFAPRIRYSLNEIVKGLRQLPNLDGYVLTGPKGGLTQTVLVSAKNDPILATGQAGLGRCVAFTSSADARWASSWLQWGGFQRFWEQAVRFASKSAQPSDCEIFADVRGRNVTLTVEAMDAEGNFLQFANVAGQVIAPDMAVSPLDLTQVGPGRYRAEFRAGGSGSYLVNLRYKRAEDADGSSSPARAGAGLVQSAVIVPYAPEFRDLSDNAALMSEVAHIAGGRIVSADPARADLFNRSGVKFPQTAMPLTKPLILIFLCVFLLDVAVRRIAIDLGGVARRVAAVIDRLLGRSRAAAAGKTLDRLRLRREKLREQLAGRQSPTLQSYGDGAPEPLASRRFDGADAPGAEQAAAELPQAGLLSATRPDEAPDAEKAPGPPEPQPTHLDRLLRAKRKAGRQLRGDKKDDGP